MSGDRDSTRSGEMLVQAGRRGACYARRDYGSSVGLLLGIGGSVRRAWRDNIGAFYLLSDFGPDLTAILKAFGAGALIAMAAETMIPEAFHNGPRYSGVLAASGFAALILLSEVAK